MSRAQKKSQRKWLYLDDDDTARLEQLVKAFPSFTEAMILGSLASAALKACETLNYRALPSSFSVIAEGKYPAHREERFYVEERPPKPKK